MCRCNTLRLFPDAHVIAVFVDWDGALDWAKASIAVAEAHEEVTPGNVALPLHLAWEFVLFEEHVVEVDHLSEVHGLIGRRHGLT